MAEEKLKAVTNSERKVPQIKICGLTKIEEANYLNECQIEYAGFVFWEKSKRNVTLTQAAKIREKLNPNIKSVSVTVDPTWQEIEKYIQAGFDVLQVHGTLQAEILEKCSIPIWRAVNIDEMMMEETAQVTQKNCIDAIVLDGAVAGAGKTFDWNAYQAREQKNSKCKKRKIVLAGGLTSENVRQGIELFQPEIVDVSSGVEDENGKSKQRIEAFVKAVRGKEK